MEPAAAGREGVAIPGLVGVRLIRLHDPNLVVGEDEVAARKCDFRHVATGAVILGHRTHLCVGLVRSRMAGKALVVIVGNRVYDLAVRVVACDAADARIRSVVALAVRKPVGLKANVHRATPIRPGDELPSAMALAAEVGDTFGGEVRKGFDAGARISVDRILEMRHGTDMTVLTAKAGRHGGQAQLVIHDRVGGVAPETGPHIFIG